MTTKLDKPSLAGDRANTNAFELAKKALGFVGKYGTPPTPQVYEVWYRFAEGLSRPLEDRMTHLMNVVGSVTSQDLMELRSQIVSSDASARANHSISKALASELSNLKSLVGEQLTANDGFNESINSAKNSLDSAAFEDADLNRCIRTLSKCTSELSEQLRETNRQLEESQLQVNRLKSELDEVRAESLTDPLTGLGNRRFLREQLQHAATSLQQNGVTFLVMIDLDNFKDVNDTHGHVVGDEALVFVAQEIRRLANDAAVGRYGGDEFCIIHRLDTSAEVHRFAEVIRESMASLRFTASTGEEIGPITVSVGVARLRREENVQKWVARVDNLTYSAKASGKNFVMVERDLTAVESVSR